MEEPLPGNSRSRSGSLSGSRESLISSKENNISMLIEKLKELRMTTQSNSNESAIYSKVESE